MLLLGMCDIFTPWKESTYGFHEALAFALRTLGNFSTVMPRINASASWAERQV